MIDSEENYKAKARKEGEFWGQATRDALEVGIPPWVDRSQAREFERARPGPFDDVTAAEILQGEENEFLLRRATEIPGGRILDLGCGAGWLSLELARRGLHVEGVDLSEEELRIAQTQVDANRSREGFGSLTYRVADLNTIEIAPGAYDVIVAYASLHHVLELERLFQQVTQGLKPQGQFLSLDDVSHEFPRRVQLIVALLYLLIPNELSFKQRVKRIWERLTRKGHLYRPEELPKEAGEASPFEGVQGQAIVPLVKQYFAVEQITPCIAFSEFAAFHLNRGKGWSYRHRYQILKVLAWIERILIRLRLLAGKSVLIIARKQSSPLGSTT